MARRPTSLIVRNLDPELIASLKRRAEANGRSAEAEHRLILQQALDSSSQAESVLDVLLRMPDVGLDSDFERQRDLGRPIEIG